MYLATKGFIERLICKIKFLDAWLYTVKNHRGAVIHEICKIYNYTSTENLYAYH